MPLKIGEIGEAMRGRAGELLRDGSVSGVLGWEKGGFCYDPTPAFFDSESALDGLVYNGFSSAMLSKYLIKAIKDMKAAKDSRAADANAKILVFLRPCDTCGFNLLVKEHRIERDRVYVIGVGCAGLLDADRLMKAGFKNLRSVDENTPGKIIVQTTAKNGTLNREDFLLEKCLSCKGGEFMAQDEILPIDEAFSAKENRGRRFSGVAEIESMTPEKRFEFWRGELSRCIRCNACRNACPVCSCNTCVFDNPRSGVQARANADSFEENMFHIIRAFHVAGRCSDCGECSRVCPQHIPLHLLNRKFIRDINSLYGEFQAGAGIEAKSPLTDYRLDDAEPGSAAAKGGDA